MSGIMLTKRNPYVPPTPEYAASETESATTSATWQNKTTLTFTAEAADYLIMWYSEFYDAGGPFSDGDARIYNNTDAVEYGFSGLNSGSYKPFSGMIKVTLTAGSKTIYLQWLANTNTAYIRRARIWAVKIL